MELYKIALRALFVYVFTLALVRLSGKRAVAHATTFDFVLALILGDMFDDLFWAEVPASQFAIGTGTLVVTHLLFSMVAFISRPFDHIANGAALMFMRGGSLLRPSMRREFMNEKEVEMLLRHKEGLERGKWAEVKSAWVEMDGRASVIKREWAKGAEKQDLKRLGEFKR
jgi:uncharacterized membrane protein YcaP (DUF421 family)